LIYEFFQTTASSAFDNIKKISDLVTFLKGLQDSVKNPFFKKKEESETFPLDLF
jgi:hypothetical protein